MEPTLAKQYQQLISRRGAGEPIAYLTGEREFWSLPLRTTPAVLIPRPETERLVELALQLLPADSYATVLDLGTGSGAIALALATERPLARLIAVDRQAEALTIAQYNKQQLQLPIHLLLGHWAEAIATESCDLVLSNPPYIAAGDPHLNSGDVAHEPRTALVSGASGLDDLTAIAEDALRCLRPLGWLLMEHGAEQGEAVLELITNLGFVEATDQRDYAGLARVIMAQKP